MTRNEHLLTIVAEEGAEIAQRATKWIRFGEFEIEPLQELTNQERLIDEVCDLLGVLQMLGLRELIARQIQLGAGSRKMDKVEKYLAYSKQCGTLTE